MAFLGLLAWLGIAAVDSVRVNAKRQRMYESVKASGAFDKELEWPEWSRISQDIHRDWMGSRKLYKKEYIPYLEMNKRALDEYQSALVCQEEIKRGYKPKLAWGYNKYSYNPFGRFEYLYGENIKIYNETGKLYF